jgi:hypothetical protein
MLGWRRSRDDFLEAMTQSGFAVVDEGIVSDALVPRSYWIEGVK